MVSHIGNILFCFETMRGCRTVPGFKTMGDSHFRAIFSPHFTDERTATHEGFAQLSDITMVVHLIIFTK